MQFIDHAEAGVRLANQVFRLRPENPVVLTIPPAGVRIGWEIARRLRAPMDVLVVQEVSVPGRNRSQIGLVVDGDFYPDRAGCRRQGVTQEYGAILAATERGAELEWERALRQNRHPMELEGRMVILASDTLLGPSALVAVETALRARGAKGIIHVAVFGEGDEAPGSGIRQLSLYRPERRHSMMLVNAGFQQTTEDEIAELLAQSLVLSQGHGWLENLARDDHECATPA